MNKWNLSRIYKDYDSKQYHDDFELLKFQVELMKSIMASFEKGVFDSNSIEQYLMADDNTEDLVNKLYNYSMLVYSTDITQTKPQEEIGKLYQFIPVLSSLDLEFTNYLVSIKNLEDSLHKTSYLKEHQFIILEKRNDKEHQLSEELNSFNERVTSPIIRQLEQLYHQTYRSKMISYNNEEVNLSVLEEKAKKDSKARELFDEALKEISIPTATSLIGIKKYASEISTQKGYNSALDQSLKQARVDETTINKMFQVLDESLPSIRVYLKHKASILHKEQLSWDKLYDKTSKTSKIYSIEQAKKIILSALEETSIEFKDHAQKVFDNNWVDWEVSSVKQPGFFCTNIRSIKESRILINFDGSITSIISLAHEIGHSYHGDILFSETTSNSKLKLNTAETASILFENIVFDYLLKTVSNTEQKKEILEYNLQMYIGVLLEVYSRFIFEKNVFNKIQEGPLQPEDLNLIMKESIISVFGDTIDTKTIQDKVWITKHHYYNSTVNYYNWHYIFGLLFSKGVQSSLFNKEKNITAFNELLHHTGKLHTEDLALYVNRDLNDINFWKKSISLIINDIKMYINT